jgi:hypothetical protein
VRRDDVFPTSPRSAGMGELRRGQLDVPQRPRGDPELGRDLDRDVPGFEPPTRAASRSVTGRPLPQYGQAAEVHRLLALGARRADIGQGEHLWAVLADPEGNEFCALAARGSQPPGTELVDGGS